MPLLSEVKESIIKNKESTIRNKFQSNSMKKLHEFHEVLKQITKKEFYKGAEQIITKGK